MKKATFVLLALFGLFFALIIGIFIGRQSISGMVVIPEITVSQENTAEQTSLAGETVSAETSAGNGKVNINTASISLLKTLPGIGQVLAQRIIDFRTENGDYSAPEDLLMVEGIGEKRLEQIREYITVGG